MKKFFSAVLVLALVLSMTGMAFAANLEASGSVTGEVTPEVDEVYVILKDGREIKLTDKQIMGCIRITSHEEAEEVMQKVREENPDKEDSELLNVMCENSWTFGENMTLLEMYDVAAQNPNPTDFMRAHNKENEDLIVPKAINLLKLDGDEQAEEKINAYSIAVIFDIKVNLPLLSDMINVTAAEIEALAARMATDYVDENSVVFFQRDYAPFSKYRDLVTEDGKVDIDAEDVIFFDGHTYEDSKSGYVATKLDPNENGPFIMYVHELDMDEVAARKAAREN